MMRRASLLFWLLLAMPATLLLAAARHADADLDALTAQSGEWAVWLLAAALAITPVVRLAPGLGWLRGQRRAIGLAAFGTSLVHLGLYAAAMGAIPVMLAEIGVTGIWTGWAALALMLPMALTSNDRAMRRLGRSWKRVQRLVYPAALLAFVHTALVHDGLRHALWLGGALLLLEFTRFLPRPIPGKASA